MTEKQTSSADRHLLDQVLEGDENGWRVLVAKFHGRMLSFARSKLGPADRSSVAEDLVQETFVSFIGAAKSYRGEGSLESFLFRILRYRINDHYRSSGHTRTVNGCEISQQSEFLESAAAQTVAGHDLTASQHAISLEQRVAFERTLSEAVFQVTSELKDHNKFRDLKIAEGLFFAGLPNQKIAELMGVRANEIGVVKHRLIKRLSTAVAVGSDLPATTNDHQLLPNLRRTWEDLRPSCPKRTTLGKYVLEILTPEWANFVGFHVDQLGCDYCRANLEELKNESASESNSKVSQQLFQSTVGFLKR
jgi:RNA polymerase sigma factor (sigma-70 family)